MFFCPYLLFPSDCVKISSQFRSWKKPQIHHAASNRSPFEVLLNRHSYSNAQSASHLNTQADSLLSVLYKNPLRGKCRQQRSAFEFHGWAVQGCSCLKSCGRPVLRATSISMNLSIIHWSISSRGSLAATKSSSLFSKNVVSFFLAIVFSFC